jgi:hypothetical protein
MDGSPRTLRVAMELEERASAEELEERVALRDASNPGPSSEMMAMEFEE